jgi:hypothetical protein
MGTNAYDVGARHSWRHSPVIMSRDFWPFQHPLSEKNSTICARMILCKLPVSSSIARRFASASMHLRAGDLRRATRAGRNRKTEAMQFDDRSDQAQAQAQPPGAAAFI